jgi:molybdate transport system substrate-binding protein
MSGRRVRPLVLLLPVLILVAPGCGSRQPVTVYAETTLAGPLAATATAFEEATGLPVLVRTGDTNALGRAIEAGAPADVFIPDGEAELDSLAARKRLDPKSRRLVGWNHLVLVVPNSAVASTPTAFTHLSILETIAVGDPDSTALGRYTYQSLSRMGLWIPVQDRLVTAQSAGQVLALVEGREVQGAFVYASDARSDKVKLALQVPDQTHDPIVYVGAVLAASPRAAEAGRFLDFLTGSPGKAILHRFGLGGS